jgi:hypothetical protein
VGCGGDEVSAWFGGAARDRHSATLSVPQRLKPPFSSDCCGTAEAVPLSEAFELCSNDPAHATKLHEWGTHVWGTRPSLECGLSADELPASHPFAQNAKDGAPEHLS